MTPGPMDSNADTSTAPVGAKPHNPNPSAATEEGRSWTKEEGTMDKTAASGVEGQAGSSAANAASDRVCRGGSEWRSRDGSGVVRVIYRRTINPMQGVRNHSDMRWSLVAYERVGGPTRNGGGVMHETDFRKQFEWVRGRSKAGRPRMSASSETGAKPSYSELETELGAVEAELDAWKVDFANLIHLTDGRREQLREQAIQGIREVLAQGFDSERVRVANEWIAALASSPGREGPDGGPDAG